MSSLPDSVHNRYPARWVGVFLVVLLTISLVGCVHTSAMSLDDLSQSLDKDILVTTQDGRTIRYTAGSFEVAMSDSGYFLRRKGSFVDGQAGPSIGARGSMVAFASIRSVEAHEKTAFYYIGPILVAWFVVIYFALHGTMKQ
jgi:hypothetical protein